MTLSRITSRTLIALATLAATSCGNAAEPSKPKVLEAIAKQGVEVMGEFPAGTQVRAFAGSSGGNPLAIYMLSDGSAVVGTRVSADGKILDQEALARLVAKPMADSAMKQLEAASWILDGSKNAPKVVYVFTDANCPYCHHFWQAARPWVDSGKVQLRHIMVGVIREDSAGKAAAIMTAPDPSAALRQNELAAPGGGTVPLKAIPARTQRELEANQLLMTSLGFQGTPGIVTRDLEGGLRKVNGVPRGGAMSEVLGPP